VLRAALAALGAYFFSTAILLVALTPVRYSLPRFGSIYYDPMVAILGAITGIGVGVAAFVAYAWGGIAAFSFVAILVVLVAAITVLPFVALGRRLGASRATCMA
jgi:hypothetical protein